MSNATAKANILGRLRAAPRTQPPPRPDWTPPVFGEQKIARFRTMLESVHGEVVETTQGAWSADLRRLLDERGVGKLLYGPASGLSDRLRQDCGPLLMAYDRPVEVLKDSLVHQAEAGVTSCRAAVAETGSLVLWPTAAEPRLMSLLPPLHVAVLPASRLFDNLAALMEAENWAAEMPTNALLISGPSKTADIEQTLAYGVHGPKALLVLLLTDA